MRDTGPFILGLDIGVQSIGWAVVDLDEANNPVGVRRVGVRCFDSGVGSEKQIEMGKDESANSKRRLARQQRRQIWRRARRQAKVFGILQRHGLLPAGPARTPQERHQLLVALDQQLIGEMDAGQDRLVHHLLPYRLRARALDNPLTPYMLGRALIHLAQRRGFLSNKKAQKEDEEEGKVKAGIAELSEEMARVGARTLGEYFSKLDPEQQRIRGRWTGRAMFEREFELIWQTQSPHLPALTEQLKRELHRALFFQRPLKSQKGLVGRCDLEPNCRRAPWASIPAQRFRFLQKLNDLEVIEPDGLVRPLTPEEREKLIAAAQSNGELTFNAIRKLLGFKKPRGAERGYEFNLEAGGEKKILGNTTSARLFKALGDRWTALPESDRERLVDEMLAFEREDALAQRLVTAWRFDESTASTAATTRLEQGYCALSRKALRKVLPGMETGERFATVRKRIYGEQFAATRARDLLPPVREVVPSLRNPVVLRALTEVRKVVNAVTRHFGKPELVRIELARDMKRGRKLREKIYKEMRENEKRRIDAKKRVLAEIGSGDPAPGDVLKMLLADECNWECPYTGRPITPATLLGASPQFDIEHIIPFSRSLDNSFGNKTLCHHEENRNVKRNRTPFEAYGSGERWSEIIRRVRRFQGPAARSKLRKFLLEEVPEDFAQRQLNDTRYISRLAAEYVGLLFGGKVDAQHRLRVQVSSGGVTAWLRDEWGLNGVLGDGRGKERSDHRHHAVDAVAIALAGPRTVRELSLAAQRAGELGHRLLAAIDPPWPDFLERVRGLVDATSISYRVDRRIRGGLHEETLYSEPQSSISERGRAAEYRHVRKRLDQMSADEVEAIVDPRIRGLVQEKLMQLGGDPKKAFADACNHPYMRTVDGRVIPIHKARIRKNVATVALGDESRRRHVAPGSNHHMEIIATTSRNGEETWEGHVVTLLEAARRMRCGEPVVKKDHGPGKRFVFSLANNEYVQMASDGGPCRLYRVTVISGNQIEFRLHSDARPNNVVKKIKGARVRMSPGSMLKARARKVAVDPLGNVLPASD